MKLRWAYVVVITGTVAACSRPGGKARPSQHANALVHADAGNCGYALEAPRAVAGIADRAVDLDGDGLPELVGQRDGGGAPATLEIQWNRGDGRVETQRYDLPAPWVRVFTVDVDGDGLVDVVGAETHRTWPQAGAVRWLRNVGPGQLTLQPEALVPPAALDLRSMDIVDLDGDGAPDVIGAVTRSVDGTIRLYRNEHARFTGPLDVPPAAGWPSYLPDALLVDDLDGDGVKDLMIVGWGLVRVASGIAGQFGAFGRLHDSPRLTCTSEPPPPGTQGLNTTAALGDIDGDRDIDLVLSCASSPTNMGVLKNRGDGSFAQGFRPSNVRAGAMSLADVDGDGKVDILSTYDGVWIHRNLGGSKFGAPTELAGRGPVLVTDFDGDGINDVLTNGVGVGLHRAKGPGTFRTPRADVLPRTSLEPATAEARLSEGWMVSSGAAQVDVYRESEGSLRWTSAAAVPSPCRFDVYCPRYDDDEPYKKGWSLAVKLIAVGDLDGDGENDVVATVPGVSAVVPFHNSGGGHLESRAAVSVSNADWRSLAVGDADGDGKTDVVLGSAEGLELIRGAGGTGYTSAISRKVEDVCVCAVLEPEPLPNDALHVRVDATNGVVIGHLDRHGTAGVVAFGSTLTVLRKRPGEGFDAQALPLPPDATAVAAVTIGDVDGDGDLDIVASLLPHGVIVAFGQTGGVFEEPRFVPTHGGPRRAATAGPPQLADVDGDGRTDVVVAQASGVALLRNDGHRDFQAMEYITPEWWSSEASGRPRVEIADVDGDGTLDVTVRSSSRRSDIRYYGRQGCDEPADAGPPPVDAAPSSDVAPPVDAAPSSDAAPNAATPSDRGGTEPIPSSSASNREAAAPSPSVDRATAAPVTARTVGPGGSAGCTVGLLPSTQTGAATPLLLLALGIMARRSRAARHGSARATPRCECPSRPGRPPRDGMTL